MENTWIVLKQLPVIEERLKEIRAEIDKETEFALSLECTEETKAEVKRIRAGLGRQLQEFEEKRKEVKQKIMQPYEAFEAIYREMIADRLKCADVALKNKIACIEDMQKAYKEKEIRDYFKEKAASLHLEFVRFENANIAVSLTVSDKKLREQANAFLTRVSEDMRLINSQSRSAEILLEYKKHFHASEAVATVLERHKAIERELEKAEQTENIRKAEQESAEKAEALSAPKTAEEIYTLRFTVKGTKTALKALKIFLDNGGYEYV